MNRYRCQSCKEYRAQPSYRRVGLGQVCSEECLHQLGRAKRPPPHRDDIPAPSRSAVHERDGGRCRFCGRSDGLHDHHIRYRSEGVDHSPENLILLCGEHHGVIHSDKRRWQPVCQAYIRYIGQGRRRFLLDIDRELNPTHEGV